MIDQEPEIKVALLQKHKEAHIALNGRFSLPDGRVLEGRFSVRAYSGQVLLADSSGKEIIRQKEILLLPEGRMSFTVSDVKIGIDFHWQRNQEQSFRGNLFLSACSDSSFNLINGIFLEDYLESVISSEMSAEAPLEFLKAQAVVARSWLVAMLAKKKSAGVSPGLKTEDEIIVWQDVNDHEGFDVCADDHCQRYQGITRIISENVHEAIKETRGEFLVHNGEICDARYYKSCGGQTEIFATAWEEASPAYLASVSDDARQHSPVQSEIQAQEWLKSRPQAYCNTTDKELLKHILPAFDQETPDFYRWQVIYTRKELEEILKKKSGIDFGTLKNLEPLERGPSGRISRLKIAGSKKTMIVGKELEIRRWLSESHLLSSAFVVLAERTGTGEINRFILSGGGWGHGVGLCQIGAAVMAAKGFKAEEILAHYFTGAQIQKLY
ncbi:MAG: amidase [Deltaproteobacteria bacterium HGW-Deltaproteobacteria-13]|nr:MAG: amidase [Deltaproteobacteria bacterium HGW-Deltaproteobacteria-13]